MPPQDKLVASPGRRVAGSRKGSLPHAQANSSSDGRPIATNERPPLAGIRVLDLTHVIAGPYCTQMLADMGADVVKVERPVTGDELRGIGRYEGREDHEDYFNASNRRKRSATFNLKDAVDIDVVRRLARVADVLVQNFAPGTAEGLGVGAETIRLDNPRLIYCAISGFGQSGPYRDGLAFDPVIQAMSGVMSVTGEPDGPPMQIGAPIADVVAGMFAGYAIVNALYARRDSGIGATIDVSLLESMIAVLAPRMGGALQGGIPSTRIGNENPMRVPAGTFVAGDGQYLTFIVASERYWRPFCEALDREVWANDPRFVTMRQRVKNRNALSDLIANRLLDNSATEWLSRLASYRVPSGPVNDYVEATADEHIRNRGLIVSVDHPVTGTIRLVGPPWNGTLTSPPLTRPPLLGEHTAEVLKDWLGDEPVAKVRNA